MDHYDQYNSSPDMDYRKPKSKLGRYMIVGGLLGAGVSLFDRGTRQQMGRALNSVKDGGSSMMMNMVHDPSQVTDQISNYLANTANNIKTKANDVSEDMRQMAEKVTGMTQSTKQAYQYAIEASGEITEIASKLRNTGSDFSLNSANQPAYLTGSTSSSMTDTAYSTYGTGNSATMSNTTSNSSSSTSNNATSSSTSPYDATTSNSNTSTNATSSSASPYYDTTTSNSGTSNNTTSSNTSKSFGNMSNKSTSSALNSKNSTNATSSNNTSVTASSLTAGAKASNKKEEAELMQTAAEAINEIKED